MTRAASATHDSAALIAHHISGAGTPPIVFVHGFSCDGSDWAAQVDHLSPRHEVITVDLHGHGETGGEAGRSIEQHGADLAALLRSLGRPPCVLVGHSMGCRVALEAALAVPKLVLAVVFVDGSQFSAAAMAGAQAATTTADGYQTFLRGMFEDMFTADSEPARRRAIVERALALPFSVGPALLVDLCRYDVERLQTTLPRLDAPLLVIQATGRNAQNVRTTLEEGARTPYLDMLRATVPGVRIAIVPRCGHFPQVDRGDRVNALLDEFIATLTPALPAA